MNKNDKKMKIGEIVITLIENALSGLIKKIKGIKIINETINK